MRRIVRRWVGIGLIVFWPVPGGFAQKPPTPPGQPSLVLRSSTQLVQVNVIALDKRGRPVADLTGGDFTLTDDGNHERISMFSVEKSEPASGPPKALPPDVFSNRWQDRSGAPLSVTLILLDAVNTPFEDQPYANRQVRRFLKQIQPNDRVAVYALGQRLRMLHDFSNDAASLARSVAAYHGEASSLDLPESPAPPTMVPLSGTRLPGEHETSTQREHDFYVWQRSDIAIAAIEDIADYLAQLPGRKNLIWVSGGFPFSLGFDSLGPELHAANNEPTALWREIERGVRALNNANLAIYPVHARGLMTDPMSSAARGKRRTTRGGGVGQAEIAAMEDLADRTGGHAFYNTNGIAYALQRALDDGRVSYALAYYPTHGKWDGKFHKIKVTVTRPGIQLRYRRGYFALPAETPTAKERKAALEAAVGSPLDATSLSLTAQVARSGQSATIKLEVDPSRITLQPQGDQWVGDLELILAQLTADGNTAEAVFHTFHLELKQDTYDRIHREGLRMSFPVAIRSGAERMRVVMCDAPSGEMGSLSIPLCKL